MTPGPVLFWLVLSMVLLVAFGRVLFAIANNWRWKAFFAPLSVLLYPLGLGPVWLDELDDPDISNIAGIFATLGVLCVAFCYSIAALHRLYVWCYTAC